MGSRPSSQDLLKKNVWDSGLCTGCGACTGLCPYQVFYNDKTVQLHRCDLDEGRCYAYCPRSEINPDFLKNSLFEPHDLTPEIGAVRGYYLARAADPELRMSAQHGGSVTALLEAAFSGGLIDSAVVSSGRQSAAEEVGVVKNKEELRRRNGSRFVVFPAVSLFNRAAAENSGNIGVVATPCQALALAKMKLQRSSEWSENIDKLQIVIGLYCGWTLAADKFKELLDKNGIDWRNVVGMDIPAGKSALEIQSSDGFHLIPFTDVETCIRQSCSYCIDSTAEYADISVGSARFGGEWEEMRRWNQVIVRTKKGKELFDEACRSGILEVREMPGGILAELKKAAVEKKKTALKNIIRKSGSAKKLLYLNGLDPLMKQMLKKIK